MATKLGEAYLQIRIKEKIALELRQLHRKAAQEIKNLERSATNATIGALPDKVAAIKKRLERQFQDLNEKATIRLKIAGEQEARRKLEAVMAGGTSASTLVIRMRRQQAKDLERGAMDAAKGNIRMRRQQAADVLAGQMSAGRLVLQMRRREAAAAAAAQRQQLAQQRRAAAQQRSQMLGQIRAQRRAAYEARVRSNAQRRFASGLGVASGAIGVASTAILAKGIDTVADSMAALAVRGIQVNDVLDKQRIVLTQLTGSAVLTNKMLNELIEFDVKTPFDLAHLSSAARMLKAAGVATQDVVPMVKKLADAAAGSGGGVEALEHITLAISQMLSKGKIQSEEMTRQLSNAGIPAWKLLAEAMGLSVGEVMKLSKEGKLGLKEIHLLINAMGKSAEGLSEKLGFGTIGNAITVIQSRFELLLADIMRPIKAPLIDTMKMILGAMDSGTAKGAVGAIGTVVGMLGKAVKFLATNPFGQTAVAFVAIATTATLVAGAIGGVVGSLIALGIAAPAALIPLGAIAALAPPMLALAAAVTAVGASFVAAFKSEHGGEFRQNLADIWKLLTEIGATLKEAIVTGLTAALELAQLFFSDRQNADVWTEVSQIIKEILNNIARVAMVMRMFFSQMRKDIQSVKNLSPETFGKAFGRGAGRALPVPFGSKIGEFIGGKMAGAKGGAKGRSAGLSALDVMFAQVDAERARMRAIRDSTAAAKELARVYGPLATDAMRLGGGLTPGGAGRAARGFGGLAQGGANAFNRFFHKPFTEEEKKKAEALKASLGGFFKGTIVPNMIRAKDRFAAAGGIGGLIGLLGNQANAVAKGGAQGIMGMFDGPRAKSEFTGISELSKNIQLGLLNSDEKKDRKQMVKGINGINAGVQMLNGALKWVGKAL